MTDRPHPGDGANAAVGSLAAAVAPELSRPLRALRDRLAVLVESLDNYVMTATGPRPYPWNDLKGLREDIAAAYLESRQVTRLAGDFASAVGAGAICPRAVDVQKATESAMNLAKHGIPANVELFIDHGDVPPVTCVPGTLILAIAQILMMAARSTARTDGGAIAVRTRADDGRVYITVSDNGNPVMVDDTCAIVSALAETMGGTFELAQKPGTGASAELSLPGTP